MNISEFDFNGFIKEIEALCDKYSLCLTSVSHGSSYVTLGFVVDESEHNN
jgi:hypothetical protein